MSDYSTIPASIVVNIDNATNIAINIQACVHQVNVFGPVGGVKRASQNLPCKELPGSWETENVEAVIVVEMFHLTSAVRTIILCKRDHYC